MPARKASYDYALIRVVPRVERGECINVGVVLFCRTRAYLGARIALDEARLLAFFPSADVEGIRAQLRAIAKIAEGDRDAGPIARFLSPNASTGLSRHVAPLCNPRRFIPASATIPPLRWSISFRQWCCCHLPPRTRSE